MTDEIIDQTEITVDRPVADVKPCPDCGKTPKRVWRFGGIFHQRTECECGRATRWVVCGHDARAESDDDTP